MKIKEFDIQACDYATVKTEILYAVAEARAEKAELLKLNISDNAKFQAFIERELKALKKAGKLQLSISTERLNDDITEARYLKNKYPEYVKELKWDALSVIVKL